MIDETWKRICGIHHEENGDLGVVWLAHDEMASTVHVYDAALFAREVPAVITTGVTARGRHIPLAWRKQDESMMQTLLDAGVNTLPDPCKDDPAMIEVLSREIWQRLRAGQLRVERRVTEWLNEYRTMQRQPKTDGTRNQWTVPAKGFPLMAATRHAIEMLPWAEAESRIYKQQVNYPKVSII